MAETVKKQLEIQLIDATWELEQVESCLARHFKQQEKLMRRVHDLRTAISALEQAQHPQWVGANKLGEE